MSKMALRKGEWQGSLVLTSMGYFGGNLEEKVVLDIASRRRLAVGSHDVGVWEVRAKK